MMRCLTLAAFVSMTALPKYAQGEGESSGESMFTAAYEFYGRAPYPLTSRGARVGYITAGKLETELSWISSAQQVLLADFRYSEYGLSVKSASGQYAYFEGGLGYRSVDIESDIYLKSSDTAEKPKQRVKEEYRALTVSLGVGAEYALTRNFVLGFDLFRISSPVHWIKKSDNFPDNSEEYEEDPKTLPFIRDGLGTNYQLARSFIKVRL